MSMGALYTPPCAFCVGLYDTPTTDEVHMERVPRILDPRGRPRNERYQAPVVIIDERMLTPEDEELIVAMDEYPPATRFRPGDIAYLTEVPPALRQRRTEFPHFWKVRFVISAWAFELHCLAHRHAEQIAGIDHAIALVEEGSGLPESRYRVPYIYAHGFPHGAYPDTAAWFPERVLKKVVFNEPNAEWQLILDEARAPFVGYDTESFIRPFTFDLAPDLYSNGENLGRPFEHEEATFHTMALLGMEEMMMRPAEYWRIGNPRYMDPEHDIFLKK